LQFLHAAKLGRIETRNPFDRIIAAPIRDERRQSGRAKSGGPASLGRRGRAVTIVREVSTALVCAAVVRIIMVKTVAGKGCCSARLTWSYRFDPIAARTRVPSWQCLSVPRRQRVPQSWLAQS